MLYCLCLFFLCPFFVRSPVVRTRKKQKVFPVFPDTTTLLHLTSPAMSCTTSRPISLPKRNTKCARHVPLRLSALSFGPVALARLAFPKVKSVPVRPSPPKSPLFFPLERRRLSPLHSNGKPLPSVRKIRFWPLRSLSPIQSRHRKADNRCPRCLRSRRSKGIWRCFGKITA